MGRVFVAQADAVEYTEFNGKTFADVVTAARQHVPDMGWQELALYNWGTKEPREVNRALIELIGCGAVDDTNPTATTFLPAAGPGGGPKILLPKLWQPTDLAVEKTHTVTVKRRTPAPAVAITSLARWFVPGTPCQLEYRLEGPSARAHRADIEIHAHGYVEIDPHGARTKSDTTADADSTHIYQHRGVIQIATPAAPAEIQTYALWKGESQATKGVLKATKAGPGTITHDAAPYIALVRYYKDDADQQAKITLSPFYPRWKPTGPLIEESLVVTWDLKHDNGKLKLGQLLVLDKHDRCVFRAALNEKRLRTDKKYDLINDQTHQWDKTTISPDAMPYRVQIQAHSRSVEEVGLAVAVMHTVVKPFVYRRAQMIGFNIRPGTKKAGLGSTTYRGKMNDAADIAARCEAMKRAIRAAAASAALEPAEDVLKVFMAPEFYFRGENGAYPVERVNEILANLRKETDQFVYADWLFVFGSIIAAIPHQGKTPTQPTTYQGDAKHNATIVDPGNGTVLTIEIHRDLSPAIDGAVQDQVPWKLEQKGQTAVVIGAAAQPGPPSGPVQYQITLPAKGTFVAGPAMLLEPLTWVVDLGTWDNGNRVAARVRSSIAKRIPSTVGTLPATAWIVRKGTLQDVVREVAPQADGSVHLLLDGNTNFQTGPVDLLEPAATEILNVALVQKGWPAPALGPNGLKAAAIFKEYVSSIDFLGDHFGDNTFNESGGGGRLITIDGRTKRMVLPTAGSTDTLGANPNAQPTPTTGTIWHDVKGEEHRVGSEINVSGEGGGSVVTIDGITFGIEVCLDHLVGRLDTFYRQSAKTGDPKTQVLLIPSWGMTIGSGPCHTVPNGLLFNVDGSRTESAARLNDTVNSCDDHPDQQGASGANCPACPTAKTATYCQACDDLSFNTTPDCRACGAPLTPFYQCPTPNHGWFPNPVCPVCNTGLAATTQTIAPKTLQPIGTGLKVVDTPTVDLTALPSGAPTDYFTRVKPLSIFEVKPIPPAAVV